MQSIVEWSAIPKKYKCVWGYSGMLYLGITRGDWVEYRAFSLLELSLMPLGLARHKIAEALVDMRRDYLNGEELEIQ